MCKSPFLQPNVWKQLSLEKLTSLSQGKLFGWMIGSFCLALKVSMETAGETEKAALLYYPYATWWNCTLIRSHCPEQRCCMYLMSLTKAGTEFTGYTLNFLLSSVWHFKLNSDEHLLCTFPSGPSSWSKSPTTRSQMKWSIALSSTAAMLKFYGMSFLQLKKGLFRLLSTCHVTLSQQEVQNQCLLYPDEAGSTTTCRFPLRSGLPVF